MNILNFISFMLLLQDKSRPWPPYEAIINQSTQHQNTAYQPSLTHIHPNPSPQIPSITMTKTSRPPRQSHHKSHPRRRSDNSSINSRRFDQPPRNADSADFSSDEYDDCSGYESAPGYDSSLETSSEYDPFFGCDDVSDSDCGSSCGSRSSSPASEFSDRRGDGPCADSDGPHPLVVCNQRVAEDQGSDINKSNTADASKDSTSNGSPGKTSCTDSKPSTTSFAPVGASAFFSAGYSNK
ncbi:hypothetical protein J3F83DRAFT_752995 [Trichoderma novae-zelandiae]